MKQQLEKLFMSYGLKMINIDTLVRKGYQMRKMGVWERQEKFKKYLVGTNIQLELEIVNLKLFKERFGISKQQEMFDREVYEQLDIEYNPYTRSVTFGTGNIIEYYHEVMDNFIEREQEKITELKTELKMEMIFDRKRAKEKMVNRMEMKLWNFVDEFDELHRKEEAKRCYEEFEKVLFPKLYGKSYD